MQTPLDALTHKTFHNNPVPVNLMLLGVAVVIGTTLVGYVWYKSKNLSERGKLEEEAEAARVERMPGLLGGGAEEGRN